MAFAGTVLSSLGEHLREQSVLAESVSHNRDLWQMLFQLDRGIDGQEYGSAS